MPKVTSSQQMPLQDAAKLAGLPELPHWCEVPAASLPKLFIRFRQSSTGKDICVPIHEKRYYILGNRNNPENIDVGLRTRFASRRHAYVLRKRNGGVFIMDLGSTNGTFLNDKQLQNTSGTPVAHQWHKGDVVRFGRDSEDDHEVAHLDYEQGGSRELRLEQPLTLPQARSRPSMEPRSLDGAAALHDTKRRRLSVLGGPAALGDKAVEPAALQNGGRKQCDKCDGPHPTEQCPNFNKRREEHKDAWLNYGRKHPLSMGGDGGNVMLEASRARSVPQPGDGSCLFHSLCYGLQRGQAMQLRREIAHFIAGNPRLEIAGDTLEEWVRWDRNVSCQSYARSMEVSGWGGGIEMAACSHLKKVNVHVWEHAQRGGFRRISCFNHPSAQRTVDVLYRGRMHYDALQRR